MLHSLFVSRSDLFRSFPPPPSHLSMVNKYSSTPPINKSPLKYRGVVVREVQSKVQVTELFSYLLTAIPFLYFFVAPISSSLQFYEIILDICTHSWTVRTVLF